MGQWWTGKRQLALVEGLVKGDPVNPPSDQTKVEFRFPTFDADNGRLHSIRRRFPSMAHCMSGCSLSWGANLARASLDAGLSSNMIFRA